MLQKIPTMRCCPPATDPGAGSEGRRAGAGPTTHRGAGPTPTAFRLPIPGQVPRPFQKKGSPWWQWRFRRPTSCPPTFGRHFLGLLWSLQVFCRLLHTLLTVRVGHVIKLIMISVHVENFVRPPFYLKWVTWLWPWPSSWPHFALSLLFECLNQI